MQYVSDKSIWGTRSATEKPPKRLFQQTNYFYCSSYKVWFCNLFGFYVLVILLMYEDFVHVLFIFFYLLSFSVFILGIFLGEMIFYAILFTMLHTYLHFLIIVSYPLCVEVTLTKFNSGCVVGLYLLFSNFKYYSLLTCFYDNCYKTTPVECCLQSHSSDWTGVMRGVKRGGSTGVASPSLRATKPPLK